jgi:hypothetical protein
MTHAMHNSGGIFGGKAFTPWQMWLDEMMDKYNERSPSRGLMFVRIVNEYVVQRAKVKGFTINLDPSSLRDKIATWAYVIDREFKYSLTPKLYLPKAQHSGQQKHWELFERTFSDDYWAYVRGQLGHADDLFGCERAGLYFWGNLTYFIYRYLNMDNSLAIEILDKEDRDIEEEERAFLISEGLLIEDNRARRQDDEYYRDAGFYRGDRRYY